jgi:hypothetical protein
MLDILGNVWSRSWIPIHAGFLLGAYSNGMHLSIVVCCAVSLGTAYYAGWLDARYR